MVMGLARSRAGLFPIRSAFPNRLLGRLPHCRFRGLLELHTHYGLPGRSSTIRGLCREVPASPVPRTGCSPAIESNHQLFEWVLPPLVICPFRAHAEARPTCRQKCEVIIASALRGRGTIICAIVGQDLSCWPVSTGLLLLTSALTERR